MKLFFPTLLAAASLACGQEPAGTPAADAPAPGLRPRLYDLAGALGNDGFKIRDGALSGVIQGGRPQRLAVNLFAGNQYWFCGATSAPGETPALSLRDPSGQPVESVAYEREGVAAVGVTPGITGRYVLEIRGFAPGTRDFCLLYLFK
jgi:hypothetical protein